MESKLIHPRADARYWAVATPPSGWQDGQLMKLTRRNDKTLNADAAD